jgi:hypothetical protein
MASSHRTVSSLGSAVALILSIALAAPIRAADVSMAALDAGEVHLPKAALSQGDYLIAIYAERPEDLATTPAGLSDLPGTLPMNCLPLVSISSAGGEPALSKTAEVTFGCRDLPPQSGIFAFEAGRWRPVPTHRTSDGRLAANFTEMATFGVFLLPESTLSRI